MSYQSMSATDQKFFVMAAMDRLAIISALCILGKADAYAQNNTLLLSNFIFFLQLFFNIFQVEIHQTRFIENI